MDQLGVSAFDRVEMVEILREMYSKTPLIQAWLDLLTYADQFGPAFGGFQAGVVRDYEQIVNSYSFDRDQARLLVSMLCGEVNVHAIVDKAVRALAVKRAGASALAVVSAVDTPLSSVPAVGEVPFSIESDLISVDSDSGWLHAGDVGGAEGGYGGDRVDVLMGGPLSNLRGFGDVAVRSVDDTAAAETDSGVSLSGDDVILQHAVVAGENPLFDGVSQQQLISDFFPMVMKQSWDCGGGDMVNWAVLGGVGSNAAGGADFGGDGKIHIDGYCYLALILPSFHHQAMERFGPNPYIADLLAMPAYWFHDVEHIAGLRYVRSAGGMFRYHVVSSDQGESLLELVRGVAISLVGMRASSTHQPMIDALVPSGITNTLGRIDMRSTLGGDLAIGGTQYTTYVGTLEEWLSGFLHQSTRIPPEYLFLLSRSAAMHTSVDKAKLKMLEALGDSALTTAVAEKIFHSGGNAQDYQTLRSSVTSNHHLTDVYARAVPRGFVIYPSGVDPTRGNTGAFFVEAVLGIIHLILGSPGVLSACDKLGVFR